MKQWVREFSSVDRDTCMNKWTFHLRQDGETIKVQSLQIDSGGQGCQGHPKTISALVKNVPVRGIDTDALAHATCPRGRSCGQILGECIASIRSET